MNLLALARPSALSTASIGLLLDAAGGLAIPNRWSNRWFSPLTCVTAVLFGCIRREIYRATPIMLSSHACPLELIMILLSFIP